MALKTVCWPFLSTVRTILTGEALDGDCGEERGSSSWQASFPPLPTLFDRKAHGTNQPPSSLNALSSSHCVAAHPWSPPLPRLRFSSPCPSES